MMDLTSREYNKDELNALFSSVGRGVDLSSDELFYAMLNSTHYIIARKNNILVGFIRSMDDNIYSANIDVLVVHNDYQDQGIEEQLLKELLRQINHIQYISVSPNESKNFDLYLKNGFEIIKDSGLLKKENL